MTKGIWNRQSLPQYARDLLRACPQAGQGVHSWVFRAARALNPFYPNKTELFLLLQAASSNCGRVVTQREIEEAIRNSSGASQPGAPRIQQRKSPQWPKPNEEQIEAIVKDGPELADLWEMSPLRFEEPVTEWLIDQLFPGNPLLCCGESTYKFATKPREDWRGDMDDLQLIVPSPMSSVKGLTKGGKKSEHALSNTGPRRFLVVEFDQGDFDDHAAILYRLGKIAPLTMALSSGGKSLHGWFYCDGASEDHLLRFMRLAVSLGADDATWTKSQFVRMPDGTRDNRARQSVYYFNDRTMRGEHNAQ